MRAADLVLSEDETKRLENLSRPVPRNFYPYGKFGEAQCTRMIDTVDQAVMNLTSEGPSDPLGHKG